MRLGLGQQAVEPLELRAGALAGDGGLGRPPATPRDVGSRLGEPLLLVGGALLELGQVSGHASAS